MIRPPLRTILLALAASSAVLALAWTPAAAQRRDALRLRITPFLGNAPFFVARDEGFFSDSGLDVEFIETVSAAETVPALARGDIDVLSAALTPGLMNGIARGARIKFVSSQTSFPPGACGSVAIVVSPALVARGALKDPSKLRGARFAAGQAFAVLYFTEKALAPYGLSPSDFQTLTVPETVTAESMRQGRLDIAVMGEPWLSRAISSGAGVVWKSIDEVLPGLDLSAVLYGPRLLDTNRDLGVRFMTAYLRAVRRLNEGKTARNVDILAAATKLSPDDLRRACWPAARNDARLTGPSLLEFQRWMIGAKLLDRPLTLDQIVEPSFVERANRALPASTR